MPIAKITTTKTGENHWNVWQDDEINLGTIEHLSRARWRAIPSNNLQSPGVAPRSRKQAIHFLRMARIANQPKSTPTPTVPEHELLAKLLDRFESAIDNEADNAGDQGWTEYADVLECDLSGYTEEQLDKLFDQAFTIARQAIDEARDELAKQALPEVDAK